MKNKFVHLHLHTEYSLLDGVGKIDEYLNRAKELNMNAMAITDHGNMFGALQFYKKARKKGIKPVIGMEIYLTSKSIEEKEKTNYHLILLAKNEIGYRNLIKLSSIGYINGFYYKPRVDKKILKKHSQGIIALSACMQGEIPRAIMNREKNIKKIVESYIYIFGKDNFYIELQDNGIPEQYLLNDKLFELAKEHGLQVVGTNDVHYVYNGQHSLQDVLICIQTGSKINDEKRMRIHTTELFMKSYEQIINNLGKYQNAVENTVKIAEKCNVELEFGKLKFPEYKLEDKTQNIREFLRKLVYEGLESRYPKGIEDRVIERVETELKIINKMGYAEYFVVIWDFIAYAKTKNIPIGPGRGSAAGSMIAYALGITELDPIKYNLLFERFLNPERVSMPDIDIDICQERRQEIIEYVVNKYGKDKVAQIITFGTLKAKAVIKDVGRVLNIHLVKVNKLTKLIPPFYTIDRAIKEIKELNVFYNTDLEIKRIIEISRGLENRVRHASIHAAGVVITKDALSNDVPLYSDSKGEQICTQYQMKELEDLGLLKMDFLGLRNLTILQRTKDYIQSDEKLKIELSDIPLDAPLVYDALQRGDTLGVFQLESQGVRKLLKKLRPNHFDDIIAVLALYRPGPLGSGMVDDYIAVKNGKKEAVYPHPSLENELKESYGVILYQEQVMKITSIMADYSLGEADLLRRAISKKIPELMEENRAMFIKRAVKKGYDKKISEDIFYLIDKFAGYGFNKSHSAAYALVAYWTAYFKEYYPKHYYAALMTSERGNHDKMALYIEDAKNHEISIALPDINCMDNKFVVDKEIDKIRFGMASIKNIGDGIIENLKKDIEKFGSYKNLETFVIRTKKYGINKKSIEALVLSGALDSLPGNRREKFSSIEKLLIYANKVIKEDEIQQMNLFGEARSTINSFAMESAEEYSTEELLKGEKEYLGFYFTGHPLDKYSEILDVYDLDSLVSSRIDLPYHLKSYGIISNIKKIITKKNKQLMATFTIEDRFNSMNCTLFPNEYERLSNYLMEGNALYIEGSVQLNDFGGNEEKKIIIKHIKYLEDIIHVLKVNIYILIDEENKLKLPQLKYILLNNIGKQRVYIAFKEKIKNRVVELGHEYNVDPSLDFIHQIEELLGKNKLKFR